MGRRRKSPGERRKKVTVSLIPEKRGKEVPAPYRIMRELIEQHHKHLAEAKIAIAWRFGKKADADGRMWLGAAKKGSDLDRALHEYDFVILLNHEVWNSSQFKEAQMYALMDHELCHCAVANDTDGNPKKDEQGRTVYRTRKHDLEEFQEVYARHGAWAKDIQAFLEARHEERPLIKLAEAAGEEAEAEAGKDAAPAVDGSEPRKRGGKMAAASA